MINLHICSLISRNNSITKKIALNFICGFETVSEDENTKFKRLKMLSEMKYFESFLNDFS